MAAIDEQACHHNSTICIVITLFSYWCTNILYFSGYYCIFWYKTPICRSTNFVLRQLISLYPPPPSSSSLHLFKSLWWWIPGVISKSSFIATATVHLVTFHVPFCLIVINKIYFTDHYRGWMISNEVLICGLMWVEFSNSDKSQAMK